MKNELVAIVERAVSDALNDIGNPSITVPPIKLETPRNPEHGDFSTNVAMVLAKPAGRPPRELAEHIVKHLDATSALKSAEIAGPGFINLRVATDALMDVVGQVLGEADAFGRRNLGGGAKVQIEFVSANPTGPLHVGHGRGAAYGAVLANLFAAEGYEVTREYYVNDAGRQMDILAASVYLRYLQLGGARVELPANGYQGAYIIDIARDLQGRHAKTFERTLDGLPAPSDDAEASVDAVITWCQQILGEDYNLIHTFSRDQILGGIETDLREFGVAFDCWFPESDLTRDDGVVKAVDALAENGHVYTEKGAQWFRSSALGDEKDRVVVRDNGVATYFASDIAYHANKYARGYAHLINIWGADHHGYISRVKAAISAMDLDPDRLEILLVQFAALFRDGEKVSMSTRSGEFVTLAELIKEVGCDAARFFYITRRSEQHLDFDLDLAKSQSLDNPVYYVQYAHARICSIVRKAKVKGFEVDVDAGLATIEQLSDEKEKQLAVQIARYPDVLEVATRNREPHQVANYLRELSADFQAFYHACKVITDDADVRNARIALSLAVRQVLANGLDLLGVSAPESM